MVCNFRKQYLFRKTEYDICRVGSTIRKVSPHATRVKSAMRPSLGRDLLEIEWIRPELFSSVTLLGQVCGIVAVITLQNKQRKNVRGKRERKEKEKNVKINNGELVI